MNSSFFKIASATLLTIVVLIPIWPPVLWSLAVVVPLVLLGIYDRYQKDRKSNRLCGSIRLLDVWIKANNLLRNGDERCHKMPARGLPKAFCR